METKSKAKKNNEKLHGDTFGGAPLGALSAGEDL